MRKPSNGREWNCLLRRMVSDLREKRFTVLGLKKAIEEGMQLWSEETHDLGGPKLRAKERQALEIADEIVKSVERAVDIPGGSEPASILFGHFGEDASAEHLSAKPSRSDGADGAAGSAES